MAIVYFYRDTPLLKGTRSLIAELTKTLGRAVKRRRQDLDWSQRELGKRSGLSANAICKVEAGSTDPHLSTLAILADALGGRVSATVEWKPDPAAPG
jgi:transcriptional regulator with XRE-family HTH domain